MAKEMQIELAIKAQDYASRVLKAGAKKIKKTAKEIENQNKKSAQAEQNNIKQTARISEQGYRQISQMARAGASARESLGIRSERAIQNEINRTKLAYDRLKASGLAGSRELAQAHSAMTARVKALNAEMGKMSFGEKMGNWGRGVAGLTAGVTAGVMAMREPVRKQMSFDRQLAMTANTAFSDRDVAGRIAGKKELFNAVENAVSTGGGTKEEALSALNTLLASGSVGAQTAMNLLPVLQKGAVATGASSDDLAQIAISSMQQMGIDEKDIGQVLDMAVAAGQAGNFELNNMARWLPQQMAAAKSTGLTGLEGLKTLLVANQQARVTAGTSDAAGNNLVNLLAKITSKETTERFKNLDYSKNGKTYGIDLLKSMENYKSQGQDSLQAFMSIMDEVIGNNKAYQELQAKLKTAKTEDQKALLDQMTNLIEGTAIGQIISDREALMALLGIRNNVQLGEKVKKEVEKSAGAVDKSHQVVKATNDYKVDDLKNTTEFAQMKSLEAFNNKLGDVSETLTHYAKAYPELTSAITGVTTGAIALGSAAAVAAGALSLLGRRGNVVGGIADVIGGGKGKGLGEGKGFSSFGKMVNVAGLSLMLTGSTNKTDEQRQIDEYARKAHRGELSIEEKQDYENLKKEENVKRAKRYIEQGAHDNLHFETQDMALIEDYFKDKTAPEAQAQLEKLRQQSFQNKYKIAMDDMKGWFTGKEKKAQARAYLESLSPTLLNPTQQKEMDVMRQEEKREKIAHAGSIVNGFGRYSAGQEEYHSAKAFLEQQSKLSEDIQTLGQSIQEGLKQAIESQEHIIRNMITVELDGRIVAENTADVMYREGARG